MNRDDIQEMGAKAAREGLTLFDCPFYRLDALPDQSAEAIAEWRANIDAWEAGFHSEVSSRPPVSGAPPPGRCYRGRASTTTL